MWHLLVLIGEFLAGALLVGCIHLANKGKLWASAGAAICMAIWLLAFVALITMMKSNGAVLAGLISFALGIALVVFYVRGSYRTSQRTTRSS